MIAAGSSGLHAAKDIIIISDLNYFKSNDHFPPPLLVSRNIFPNSIDQSALLP